MLVRYAKLDSRAFTPRRKNPTDAGLDLYSLEHVVIEPFGQRICRTGITLEVPEGYMVRLLPKGKSNYLIGSGVVDSFYQPGEILVRIFNPTEAPLEIKIGDPICQAVYVKIEIPEVAESSPEDLKNNSGRSDSGGIKNV